MWLRLDPEVVFRVCEAGEEGGDDGAEDEEAGDGGVGEAGGEHYDAKGGECWFVCVGWYVDCQVSFSKRQERIGSTCLRSIHRQLKHMPRPTRHTSSEFADRLLLVYLYAGLL